MKDIEIYKDISKRTNGDIYIGVVGPVRTGKSTFIKNFMENFVIPNIENEYKKDRAMDELPQSASGKTIMTTEPKFVPNESVEICLDNNVRFKTRLVDCVGYLVEGAVGHLENDMPRMVRTPWSQEEIPFSKAAEIGTKKVINDHSTIGIVAKEYLKNTGNLEISNKLFGEYILTLMELYSPEEIEKQADNIIKKGR